MFNDLNLMTWFTAWVGGLILGVAVLGYLFVNGRIAGISGLMAQALNSKTRSKSPALWFLLGLMLVPMLYAAIQQPQVKMMTTSPFLLIVSGLLVGFGTRLGSGCTSGHGICGISRLSKRSMVATCTFIAAGAACVWITRHWLGVLV
ncbi:YeeE/YedE family protein [Acinetobacter pullicarnis]|uniref:YeeE/YedE family protein n=1 Tax=Acinetobacter pullicarnis TaxID=2576829 RepID=UPI001E2EE18E|nr:YeeE/YedE family protein [Acinetobacter pullicarnis]